MKTNRSLVVVILLSLITFGIYGLYFWSCYARDMNIVCQGDGKHTRGILFRIVVDMLTFGIYELIWMYGAGERISMNAHKQNIHCNVTGGSVLLWYILGAFIFIGPLVGMYKLIDGLNSLCAAYNSNGQSHGGTTINVNVG